MNKFFIYTGKKRDGYMFLLTVLFVGTITFSIMAPYVVLGITAMQNSMVVLSSEQALANAYACADKGLFELQANLAYGGETLTLTDGTCTVHAPAGTGANSRTLCIEGTSGNTTRKFEILVDAMIPNIEIGTWREVEAITSCTTI